MSDEDFRRRVIEMLDAHKRKIAVLAAVKDGKLKLRRVKVTGYHVRSYDVGTHWRLIAAGKRPAHAQ